MVFKRKIPVERKALIYCKLYEMTRMSKRAIARACGVAPSSVRRILKGYRKLNEFKTSSGRPRKLSAKQERLLLRKLPVIRENNARFTIRELMQESGVKGRDASESTVQRFIKRMGYRYLSARKKGVLKKADLKERLKFVGKMRREYDSEVWTKQIAFYLDGVSLAYKRNPAENATAPKGRVWRKVTEGTSYGCTGKGSKEGTGGKVVKLIVAISYNEGVVLCQPYKNLNGPSFARIIRRNFNRAFALANKNNSRLWIQDGDPSQNSEAAKVAMQQCDCKETLIRIPARSPDLNPIENIFHILKESLRKNAIMLEITNETFQQFQERVMQTLYEIPVQVIDNAIASMPKRLLDIRKNKGGRTKY